MCAQPTRLVPVWDARLASDPFVASVQLDRAIVAARSPADLVYYDLLGSGSNGVVYKAGLSPLLQLHIPNVATIRFAAKFVYNFGVTTSKVCVIV